MPRCRLLIIAFHNLRFPGKTNLTDPEDARQSTPARLCTSSEIDEEDYNTSASDVNLYATVKNGNSSTRVSKRKKMTPLVPTRRQSGQGRPPKQSQSLGDLASQGTAGTNASATAAKMANKNTQRKTLRKEIETAYLKGFMSPDEVHSQTFPTYSCWCSVRRCLETSASRIQNPV